MSPPATRRTIAVGPVMPGWGSWDWVGAFLVEHLAGPFRTTTFEAWARPDADVVVVIKHVPPAEWVAEISQHTAIIFCPIDRYGDAGEIDADAEWLQRCSQIIVHCRRLEPYFSALAPTTYLDHPLKFITPVRKTYRADGPLLWVGVRSNLSPLVEWVNRHPLPAPLDVLTNPEEPGKPPTAIDLGFRSELVIRVHEWSPERHRQFTAAARAAVDIKGDDFRGRHKPPAKALDFIASGLPLAMNPGTSAAEHLAALGLKLPSPLDTGRWLSEEYWKETRRLGEKLTRTLAPRRVASRFRKVIESTRVNRPRTFALVDPGSLEARYEDAHALAVRGEHMRACTALSALDVDGIDPCLRAQVRNDLAALAALAGDFAGAADGFRSALQFDPDCVSARANLSELVIDAPVPGVLPSKPSSDARAVRVAVVSLLFNWPSTGGGNIHTAELTWFLAEAGYDVRHIYARYDPWGIGRITETTPYPAEVVDFTDGEWTAAGIVEQFRRAIDAYDPDWVVLTDSWNLKPLLAAAAGGRPYVLRLQALECLCPLNNVRLLPGPDGTPRQCMRHQLATPDECARCVRDRDHTSGDLHRAERNLAGFGTSEYRDSLVRAFAGAATVLVVNPLIATMVEPYAKDVRVVTAGMNPARFPVPLRTDDSLPPPAVSRLQVLFAGLAHEWMKGFHVLREGCTGLWQQRHDFEVIITDDPPVDGPEPWARYIGWQTQVDLPQRMTAADVVVVPTVAQEALGRTAVEAMAAARPVVASRIGGLPFTVADGATGLLCEPGNPVDLATKLSVLLDDPALRQRLGSAGRRRFEEHYSWPAIIDRHYRPLFGEPIGAKRMAAESMEPRQPILVVVSHYAARSIDPLVQLLDSMIAFPAGAAYAVRVVVNRDRNETIRLPERHSGVEIIYRVNSGYNIGAWETGWRTKSAHSAYLFVQDECRVIRPDWVAAFARVAAEPGVGLVGECASPDWDAPWPVLAERFRGCTLREHIIDGRPAERVDCYLDFFRRRNIPPGACGDHLQSLILFATRTVLKQVGGFPEGHNYGEAIAAEIGVSKAVQAAGLRLAQVAPDAFTYLEHPQWLHRRTSPGTSSPGVRVGVGQ